MPICLTNKKNVLFIHIPRTGGTNILNALAKNGYSFLSQKYPESNNQVSSEHLTSEEVNKILSQNNINVDFEFTVVRNPYTKLESEYFYRFKSIFRLKKWGMKTLSLLKSFSGFNNFIKKELNIAKNNPSYRLNHFRTQTKFLSSKTRIYKYENNFIDLKKDLLSYGIDFQLGKKQFKGRLSKMYKIKWEKSTLQLVNEYYKDDFEAFGYEKK